MTIARDGIPIIITLLVPGVLLFALAPVHHIVPLTVIGAALTVGGVFSLAFFRNPRRHVPDDPDVVVAPADGKIVQITEVDDEFVGSSRRIDIFLSIFDVHLNRTPFAGSVAFVTYRAGTFASAFTDKASRENERADIGLETDLGRMRVAQIAGLIARRIVCRLKESDNVVRGQLFGMIRFGSRTELTVPVSVDLCVQVGQKVRAGSTVVGRKSHGA